MACDSGVSLVNLGPSGARSCLALLTCSLPSTGRDLSQGTLSDFAEKPQVLRLRLAPRTRQTPLRMTTLVGISTEPSCLIYAFSAWAKDLRPALIAGLIRGVSGFGLFMRQLGFVDMLSAFHGTRFVTRDIVRLRRETAGPSTTFGAKNAPNSAQDDNSCWDFNRARQVLKPCDFAETNVRAEARTLPAEARTLQTDPLPGLSRC
jgi:hypothetical protein